MAFRVSFFFFAVILGSVLVNGQPPMDQQAPPVLPTTPPPSATPAPSTTPPPPTVPGATPPPPTVPGATPPPPSLPASTTGAAPSTTGGASALPPVQAAPECAALATKCLDDIPFVTGESIFWVGKIYVGAAGAAGTTPGATGTTPGATGTTPGATGTTPGATPPAQTPPANPTTPAAPCTGGDNTCSITSYKPESCQAIKIIISRNEDGSICMKEATFNKATNSVALFKNTWLPADPQKAILKQIFGYYGTMDQSGTVKIVDPSPPDVKTTQAVDFVLVGASEGGEWIMFSTCCKSVVFVLYSDAIVCAKSMQTFDAAITPLVTPLGIQFTDLKPVPFDVTIKLDNFIPALPPAAAAAAATAPATTTGVGATPSPTALPATATPTPTATTPPATPPPANTPPATPPPP